MICKKCNQQKNKEDFYSTNKSICKECLLERRKRWIKDNQTREKAIRKRYRERHKEKLNQYSKEWYEKNRKNCRFYKKFYEEYGLDKKNS